MADPDLDLMRWVDEKQAAKLEWVAFCYICSRVMLDPVQVPCGHSYCKACITGYLEDIAQTCPACWKPIDKSQVVPNAAATRILRDLPRYKCPKCSEVVGDPRGHMGVWDDCPRKCGAPRPCNKRSARSMDYDEHGLFCPKALVLCDVCKGRVPSVELNEHMATCYSDRVIELPFQMRIQNKVTGDEDEEQDEDDDDELPNSTSIKIGGRSVKWRLEYGCNRTNADLLQFRFNLAPVEEQPYRRNLHSDIKRVTLEVHHPITNELLFTTQEDTSLQAECFYVLRRAWLMPVCSLKELQAKGGYDPTKGLVELPVILRITVDRLWDPLQRPGKRQNRGIQDSQDKQQDDGSSAMSCASSPSPSARPELLTLPVASIEQSSAVQVIVAQ